MKGEYGELTVSERYDKIAQIFKRETQLIAPGKDVSPAVGAHLSMEKRENAWADWYPLFVERCIDYYIALNGMRPEDVVNFFDATKKLMAYGIVEDAILEMGSAKVIEAFNRFKEAFKRLEAENG